MEIKRDAYLQQLIERKDNGMIKVITGIRRCGKSFLLFTIFKRYLLENGVDVDHIIEIALDGIENEELRDPKVCFKYIKDAMKDDGKYYLLLDEVQFMSQFEEVLNSLLRMSNIDVYVTGSNSKFLSSDIVTEFRGRGDEIRIYPLSFAEFYSVYDGDYDDAWDDYMIYGGLPQIVSFQSERQKADYLKNIFANVYLKDVIERNKIQNVDEIGILVDVLASAIGAPTNPSKIANTFASERQMTYANKTISKHIDHLTDAFLISKASRYDIKGRKYIGANLKYYFTDLGLRNARLNFRQQEPTHIMENIVYNELLIRGYNVDVGVVDIFDKDKEGKRVRKQLEVDFVVNQGNQRYYIQVAYDMTSEEKQTQEFNSLRNIPDSFKKIVIVNGSKKPWRNDEGFVIMGMKYFLLNANSQGVISLLFAVLLAAAAVLSAQKGNTGYVVLYIIVGILVLLYVPFSLKGRVKMIMKTNEVFSKPLHFEIDEKNIKVSQGEEMAQLPWEQVYRFVANDKRILIFSNRKNAYILSKEQLGDSYEPLKELAGSTLEKYRLKIK